MKPLRNYINIRSTKSVIKANDKNIREIVMKEISRLGYEADLNHIDTSEVTDMLGLFSPIYNKNFRKELAKFNGDVSKWDVSNVTEMIGMFRGCKKFNGNLGEWDISKVISANSMFNGCSEFEGKGLENWDLDKIKFKKNMFDGCLKMKREKTNDDPTTWEVGDIICGTAGATMSLPRFFKIVKKTNLKFTCIRLKGKLVSGHYNGQWQEVASEEQYDNREYTGVANKFGSLKIDDTYMKLWDGKPLYGDDQD